MIPRHRLLQIVTLLLYLGPLVAGLARHGLAVLPAFVAIFVLWQILMRPADWPRRPADWTGDGVIAGALARVLLMVVLVALCYALGRGLSGAVGAAPAVPLAVPLLMSFIAVPLARLLWNPAEAAAMDGFLDDAIARLETAAPPGAAAHLAEDQALAQRLLEPLAGFPADTPPETIAAHLRAMATQVEDARLRAALMARMGQGDAPAPLVMALALHASDARLIEALGGDDTARAFHALPDHPAALAQFATRAKAALAADADLWGGFPDADSLAARAERMAGSAAEGPLRALIDTTRHRAPPDA